MAQGSQAKLMDEIEDSFLLCKICFEIYKRPKTLVCLHVFCEGCIEKLADVEFERSYRYMLYTRTVTCPLCRKKTELPGGGVRRLPDNFLVANLAEVLDRKKPKGAQPLCEICKPNGSPTTNVAVSKCLDCSKLLCKSCVDLHRKTKVTAAHGLYDIEVEKNVQCKSHPDEVVRFYCEPCEKCICVVCTFQEHKGHDVSSFTDGMQKYAHSLDTLLSTCKERMTHLREQIHLIDTCEGEIKHTEEHIHDVAIDTIGAVRRKEKEMVDVLKEVFGRSESVDFFKTKDDLQDMLENIQGTCHLTEMILKDKSIELLLLRKEIQQKLEGLITPTLEPIPTNIPQQVKFVPGSLTFGYLDVDGQGTPVEYRGIDFPIGSKPSESINTQTDSVSMKESATSMGHITDCDAPTTSRTDFIQFTDKASSPHPIDCKSEVTLAVPDMQNSFTMTPNTPAIRRRLPIEQVVHSTQSTGTAQTDTSHMSTNTLSANTAERSTLTKRLSFIDEITDTSGLVLKKDQETFTPLLTIRSAGTLTDFLVTSHKGTSTMTPEFRNKITSTPRLSQTTRETMTPYISMLDMGVTANIPGIDKASATKTTIMSDSSVTGGDVRTNDAALDPVFDPIMKLTVEKGTMPHLMTVEKGIRTEACVMLTKDTYTNFFNMRDQAMETDELKRREFGMNTVNTQMFSVGVETIKRKLVDKGVHVQEKVAKLETRTCPTQTTVCLHHYIPIPNSIPCNQATNTSVPEVKTRETSTLQVQLKDCGVGSFQADVADTGVGEGNVHTSDMGISTLRVPTSTKGVITSKVPSSTKGTTTLIIPTSSTGMLTDQTQTRDSANDAYKGEVCDADCNTNLDIVVKEACQMSNVATSPVCPVLVDKGTGVDIKLSTQGTETHTNSTATSTNTIKRESKEFGTTMSSNVITLDIETGMTEVTTKDANFGDNSVLSVEEGTETEKSILVDAQTDTIIAETATTGVGTSLKALVDSSTYMFQPVFKNTGVNPEPKVMLEKRVNTEIIDSEDRGTGPAEKYTFTKGTATEKIETRSVKTHTKIPVLEKATYMPQTVTIDIGTSAIAETAEKTVATLDKDMVSSASMTTIKQYNNQETSMGRGVQAKDSGTSTALVNLTETGTDATQIVTKTSTTNTMSKKYRNTETTMPQPKFNTIGTTTNHSVFVTESSFGTPTIIHEDKNVGHDPIFSSDTSTMTHVKTRNIGVLKRPHTVTRGMGTPSVQSTDSSTKMETSCTMDSHMMTENVDTCDKGITSRPIGLIGRGTGMPSVQHRDIGTVMKQTLIGSRGTSPIPPNTVDRHCSPLRTEMTDRQSSPIPLEREHNKIGVSSTTTIIQTCDSSTSDPIASFVDRQCSPIIFESESDKDIGTSAIVSIYTDRQSSPIHHFRKDESTVTTIVNTTERGSTPVRIPTRSCGVHVGVMMETKACGTPNVRTTECGTDMPHIVTTNTGIVTNNIYVSEKETSMPQVHQIHRNVATESIYTLDASTSTPVDIVASYLGAIKPTKTVTITRGTATETVEMVTKELSPIRAFYAEKASSPVRILKFDKGVNVSKGEITAPVDKFQKVGALTKGRAPKPIADCTKLKKLDSIEEDAENRSSGSEDENIIGGFGSMPALPTFPRHKLRPRPNLFTDSLRPPLFNLGPKHTEKFWPSSPRLGINKGLQVRPSSMFNVAKGRGSPSSILMKVEMGTNTSDVFSEDRGTSTPPIEKHDKAICTESLNMDGRMAECINKLKTVRQRLESSPTYSQANSPNSTPTPRLLSPPVQPTSKDPPLLSARSKSVGDGLDESDDYSPFVSPLPLRKANAVLDSMSESSDSDKAVSMSSICPDPPQSPKFKQELARKQRLDLSQMLRSASMPESEHPPFSPMPKPKILKPKVIPPLDFVAFKQKEDQCSPKTTAKRAKPRKATRTMTKFTLTPQIEEEQTLRHSGSLATEKLCQENKRVMLQTQLPFEERRAISRTLLHPIMDSGSSSGSDSSGTRSPSHFRNLRQTPKTRVVSREVKTASSFKSLKDDKK